MTDISANGSLPDQIQQLLDCNHQQLVLAESCTAGLAASRLGGVPGISRNFCGSSVVYQEGTKQDWLDISESLLESEGAVSEPVARQMALNSLQQTGTATLATSITGHLGPGAPAELDGQVFVGVAHHEKPGQLPTTLVVQRRLEPETAAAAATDGNGGWCDGRGRFAAPPWPREACLEASPRSWLNREVR